MKLNKLFFLGLLALTATFTACSDDDDNYAYGPEVTNNINNDVTFATSGNLALNLTDTSFDIILQRPDSVAAQELTVPIQVVNVADVFTVPESVTFAAGSSKATLTIKVSDKAEAFVDYPLNLAIPSDFSLSTYKAGQSAYPVLGITVHKEDYKEYGVMNYYSWLFETAWTNVVYYSEYLKLYRAEIFADGYPFYFTIDEKGLITITDATGAKLKDTVTGSVDENYGMITYRWLSDNFTGWDADEEAYFIPVNYRVSAGSFGSDYDYFTLTKK